jgi:hypothetical protein
MDAEGMTLTGENRSTWTQNPNRVTGSSTNPTRTTAGARWEAGDLTAWTIALGLKTALFWGITQRVVAISYRRFGITYRSHIQGPRIQGSFWVLEPCGWDR